MATPTIPLVARKTITTIQEGSVYKERFLMPTALPSGTEVRLEFRDSSGATVLDEQLEGEVDGFYVTFRHPYSAVEAVPNGAGFYCYVQLPDDDVTDWHMVTYGTVFRRQLTFPNSPATSALNLPRKYEDSFQRPPGSPGGKWKFLVGQPRIVSTGLLGIVQYVVSLVFSFYQAYFMRYYVPFAGDTITLSVTLLRQGLIGKAFIALACSSDGSAYIYACFDAGTNTVSLGRGTGPDVSKSANLIQEATPVSLTVPTSSPGMTVKIRYDDVTKTLGVYSADYSTEYITWTDDGNEAPHGKGYRYFAIAETSSSDLAGMRVAHIKAQDDV